jgi:hypothetical protein
MESLAAGLAITVIAMLFILAFQGHGWGYRYLHGFLGSVCLLAAFAWVQLVEPRRADRAWAALGAATALSVLVAFPVRAMQVSTLIAPFARAHDAIEASNADVVVVDPMGVWYGQDLVRNDPFLASGPKVMSLGALDADKVQYLCTHYRVRLFDRSVGATLGMTPYPWSGTWRGDALRALMKRLSCDGPVRPAGRDGMQLEGMNARQGGSGGGHG